MAEAVKRRFYLRDPNDGSLGGQLGLGDKTYTVSSKTGLIDPKLYAANLEELERKAVTYGHPVEEGEPE